jgi:hypothetical protein
MPRVPVRDSPIQLKNITLSSKSVSSKNYLCFHTIGLYSIPTSIADTKIKEDKKAAKESLVAWP